MAERSEWDAVATTVEFSAPLDLSSLTSLLSPSSRVLDLGCGYGRISAQLDRLGYAVVGVDSSEKLIERGRSTYPNLELRVADATETDEPNASFQAVVISALLSTVPSADIRAAIISEIRRLLVPGGLVVGVDYLKQNAIHYTGDGLFRSTNGIVMKHFQVSELESLFSGFTKWECETVMAKSLSGMPIEAVRYHAELPHL